MNKYMLQASFLMFTVVTSQLFGASDSGCQLANGSDDDHASVAAESLRAVHEQMLDVSSSVVLRSTSRRIDSFSSEVDGLPDSINRYSVIAYLPNSKFDRLRVTLPTYGAPVGTSAAPLLKKGSFKYVDQTAPLTASPLKIATIGQILNANPFKGSSIPTARKWLQLCVSGDGIDELVLDQTNESYDPSAPRSSTDPVLSPSQAAFKVADKKEAKALLAASCLNRRNLEMTSAHLPAPTDYAQNLQLGILFGEVEPRRGGDPHAAALHRSVANKLASVQGWGAWVQDGCRIQ